MGFLRSFKRKIERKGQSRKIRRKPFIEMLEPRILLSAESLVHAAAAADNALDLKLQLDDVTEELQLIDTMDQSLVQSRDFASTTEVVITGADQDDTLIIDMDPSVSLPISFDGGDGSDSQTIEGGEFSGVTYSDTGNGSGIIELDGTIITYTDVEFVTDTSDAAERVYEGTDGSDEIRLTDDDDAANDLSAIISEDDLNILDRITFAEPTDSLNIDLAAGDDTLFLESLEEGFAAVVTLEGGLGDDTLESGDWDTLWNITGFGEGTVNDFTFTGFENLTSPDYRSSSLNTDPFSSNSQLEGETVKFLFDIDTDPLLTGQNLQTSKIPQKSRFF